MAKYFYVVRLISVPVAPRVSRWRPQYLSAATRKKRRQYICRHY